jgi:hypothetical protein
MLNKIMIATAVAGLIALLVPAKVDAYGAAHVGYTHVGPNGVYHAGATAATGPSGGYGKAGAEYSSENGGVHAGYGGAAVGGYGGAAAGGYHYTTGYSGVAGGGAAVGGAHYEYVR